MKFTNSKSKVKQIDVSRYWRAYPPSGGFLNRLQLLLLCEIRVGVDSEVFEQVQKHLYMLPTGSYTTKKTKQKIKQEIER